MTPAHRVRGRDDVGEREVGLPPAMEDFAAAAWITLPFAAYILLLGVVAPFGDAQWSRGDPIGCASHRDGTFAVFHAARGLIDTTLFNSVISA